MAGAAFFEAFGFAGLVAAASTGFCVYDQIMRHTREHERSVSILTDSSSSSTPPSPSPLTTEEGFRSAAFAVLFGFDLEGAFFVTFSGVSCLVVVILRLDLRGSSSPKSFAFRFGIVLRINIENERVSSCKERERRDAKTHSGASCEWQTKRYLVAWHSDGKASAS